MRWKWCLAAGNCQASCQVRCGQFPAVQFDGSPVDSPRRDPVIPRVTTPRARAIVFGFASPAAACLQGDVPSRASGRVRQPQRPGRSLSAPPVRVQSERYGRQSIEAQAWRTWRRLHRENTHWHALQELARVSVPEWRLALQVARRLVHRAEVSGRQSALGAEPASLAAEEGRAGGCTLASGKLNAPARA